MGQALYSTSDIIYIFGEKAFFIINTSANFSKLDWSISLIFYIICPNSQG